MDTICPDCLATIETDNLQSGSNLTCPACGGSFRVELNSTIARTICEPDSTAPAEPVVSQQRLGRFVLFELVGSGGFGEVFRAYDTDLERTVAIKIPNQKIFARPDLLRRVHREAKSAGQLHHPAIVAVLEWGESNGLPYIVYEFVQGQTLAGYASAEQPGFREIASMIRDIARGLHYAHGEGIVHRDVKPGNILIDQEHQVRLTDFGLAKIEDESMTRTGDVLGTLAYMSPEQARGQVREIDHRSDVYSLGATLYELLCGRRPFSGSQLELLEQVANREPPGLTDINGSIPADLAAVCHKSLEKEKSQRYESAGELAEDLNRWLTNRPVKARKVGLTGRATRWCRRNRAVAASGTAVFVTLVAATIVTGLAYQDSLESLKQYRTQLARSWLQKANSFADDDVMLALPWIAAAADLDRDDPQRLAVDLIGLESGLAQCAGLVCDRVHSSQITVADASRDGHWLLTGDGNGTVKLWDCQETCGEVHTWQCDSEVRRCQLSTDGRFAAVYQASGIICVWDAGTGEQLAEWSHEPDVDSPSSPVLVKTIQFRPHRDDHAFTPLIASADLNRNSVSLWNARTGQLTGRVHHDDHVHSATFDSTGNLLLTASGDRTAGIWEIPGNGTLDSSVMPQRQLEHQSPVIHAAFCSERDEIVTACIDGSIHIWDRHDGRELHPSPQAGGIGIPGITCSPDGRYLVVTRGEDDSETVVWDLKRRKMVGAPLHGTSGVTSIMFSGSGSTLAIGRSDGSVNMIKVVGSRLITLLPRIHHHHRVRKLSLPAPAGPDAHPDIIACLDNGTIRRWSCNGEYGATLQSTLTQVNNVQAARDSSCWILRGASREPLQVVSSQAGKLTAVSLQPPEQSSPLHQSQIFCAAVSPNGQWVATGGLEGNFGGIFSGSVVLWDARSGRPVGEPMRIPADFLPRSKVAFDNSSTHILAESSATDGRRTIQVWKVADGRESYALTDRRIHAWWNQSLPTFNVAEGNIINVRDPTSPRVPKASLVHSSGVSQLYCPQNSPFLLSQCSDGSLHLWDLRTNRKRDQSADLMRRGSIAHVNSETFVLINSRDIHVHHISPGFPLKASFTTAQPVRDARLSPDMRFAAILEQDGSASLWDLNSAERITRLGHWTTESQYVGFTTRGKSMLLAGRSRDKAKSGVNVCLWPLTASTDLPDASFSTIAVVSSQRVENNPDVPDP